LTTWYGREGREGIALLGKSFPARTTAKRAPEEPTQGLGDDALFAGGASVSSDRYITYGWQTDAGWAGTCRQFRMQLNDGTPAHTADFMFLAKGPRRGAAGGRPRS